MGRGIALAISSGPRGGEALFLLALLAALGVFLLAFMLWAAARARRKPVRRPAKKTFEHGRRLARFVAPASATTALDALGRMPVGKVTAARADADAADVTVERRRNQPCPQAAGYLVGLFESAWAHEVLVTHPECGGARAGTCRYVVRKLSGSDAPGAGASTPGSGAAHHRSPRARSGAG